MKRRDEQKIRLFGFDARPYAHGAADTIDGLVATTIRELIAVAQESPIV